MAASVANSGLTAFGPLIIAGQFSGLPQNEGKVDTTLVRLRIHPIPSDLAANASWCDPSDRNAVYWVCI